MRPNIQTNIQSYAIWTYSPRAGRWAQLFAAPRTGMRRHSIILDYLKSGLEVYREFQFTIVPKPEHAQRVPPGMIFYQVDTSGSKYKKEALFGIALFDPKSLKRPGYRHQY